MKPGSMPYNTTLNPVEAVPEFRLPSVTELTSIIADAAIWKAGELTMRAMNGIVELSVKAAHIAVTAMGDGIDKLFDALPRRQSYYQYHSFDMTDEEDNQ
jgi:hypothetical protein